MCSTRAPRRLVDLRDGKQSGLHHRRAAARAALDAASRRRRSRSTSSRICRGATRRTCSSSRWGSGNPSTRSTRAGRRTCSASSRPRSACSPRPRAGRSTTWTCTRRGRGRARAPRRCVAGELPAGSVAAQRTTHRREERRRRRRAVHARTGTAPPTSSRRGISGRPAGACACTATRRSTSSSRSRSRSTTSDRSRPAYTANRPVNAIPYVCAAAPGILATADLPPITPAGPRDAALRAELL